MQTNQQSREPIGKGTRGEMNKLMRSLSVLGVALLSLSGVSSSFGAPVLSEDFNSYSLGNLNGQGGWTAISGAGANAIQVVSPGRADLPAGTGEDDSKAFTSSLGFMADGTSFYYGLTINMTTAQTGEYFASVSAGTSTSLFYNRLFAKATTGGFLLGIMETSGTGSVTNYGSTVLSLGTDYRVVVAQHIIAGPLNDTLAIYVDPTDVIELNNTAYVTKSWTTANSETNSYGQFNLRQGVSGAGPAVVVDDIVVGQDFSEVAMIPEPSTMLLVGLGLVGLWTSRRRRS